MVRQNDHHNLQTVRSFRRYTADDTSLLFFGLKKEYAVERGGQFGVNEYIHNCTPK